ncbi:MAG: hypothetical protein CMP34_04055 [Rickettsiales bacterium]|nr:hypothetical protein [Rickettsiales bacterium]|tara:strand:- start:8 stop:748 length:741 start_codon:yes stop_codon:yes gene_type:complete
MYSIKNKGEYVFCFFNRMGGVSKGSFSSLNCSFNKFDKNTNVKKNREIAKNFISEKKEIIFVNQIHSNKVIFINDDYKNEIYKADAMVSSRKDIILGILTADCAPIVVLSKKNFGIIHAGWKGLISGIIENTFNEFVKRGEGLENLKVFVGPHLKTKSFEIKNDFVDLLRKKIPDYKSYILREKNIMKFDFSSLILNIIRRFNIESIEISDEDTFSNNQKFFSYRFYSKQGIKNCGRQISLVGIKD